MIGNFGYSQLEPGDIASDFTVADFHIRQVLAQVRTVMPVQVNFVQGATVASPGIVNVVPLVNQTDGQGNSVPHATIYNVPVWRHQAGNSAIILNPKVGDIGLLACADRDISSVKVNKAASNPASLRRHNFADGIYLGGILNAAPTTYVQLDDNGITLHTSAGGASIKRFLSGSVLVGGTIGPQAALVFATSVLGAQIGDAVLTGFSGNPMFLSYTAYVSAADVVTVNVLNPILITQVPSLIVNLLVIGTT